MLGIVLRRQADHKGALDQFRTAVRLNPDDADAQYNLGRELKADGDTAGAIAAFRRAIELKPDFEQAHYNLALALRSQGDAGSAKKELDELSGLHEFRSRLAQSKLLILQGVDALKKQKFDDALASIPEIRGAIARTPNQLLLPGPDLGGQERTSASAGSLRKSACS